MSKFITKNKEKVLLVLVLLTLLGFVFYFSPPPNLPLDKGEEQRWGNDTSYTYMYTYTNETSVYNFMDRLRSEGKITFTDKTYAGMGKFIDSINGTKNNGSQSWIYYVNEVEAQVGVSNYKINKGDIISWKYEKSY